MVANIIIVNNSLAYTIHDNRLDELKEWLDRNGEVAGRELMSKLARKPLAPDLSIEPELRCPLEDFV